MRIQLEISIRRPVVKNHDGIGREIKKRSASGGGGDSRKNADGSYGNDRTSRSLVRYSDYGKARTVALPVGRMVIR